MLTISFTTLIVRSANGFPSSAVVTDVFQSIPPNIEPPACASIRRTYSTIALLGPASEPFTPSLPSSTRPRSPSASHDVCWNRRTASVSTSATYL